MDARTKNALPVAPCSIIGNPHSSMCLCGCRRVQGRVGRLVQDSDTAALADFGIAFYSFPKEWPFSEETVCFSINDAGREFLGLSDARVAA